MKWDISKRDYTIVELIANRAVAMAYNAGVEYDRNDAVMDITAAHLNGNPLRLGDLLAADDFNFSHDVFGIRRYLNRRTGELGDCFVPRFSAPEQQEGERDVA